MQPVHQAMSADDSAALHEQGATVAYIGNSADDHELFAYTIGDPKKPTVSIVAGAHPDEPAGPVAALALAKRFSKSAILQQVRLAIVPILDIDGIYEQREWLDPFEKATDPVRYMQHRLRRLPGADREFAWPGAPWGGTILPECAAAADFLDAQGPAIAHLSLHGMAVAEGAWFLLDHLAMRDEILWSDLKNTADNNNFNLHESFRYGDKGFRRSGKGFCTTPSGIAMRFWAKQTEQIFADHFAYGSMDAARLRCAKAQKPLPLCAVSEFPLFSIDQPGKGDWRELINTLMISDEPLKHINDLKENFGFRAVPFADQVNGMLEMVEAVVAAALRRIKE